MKHNLVLLGLLSCSQATMSQAEAESLATIDLAFLESFSVPAGQRPASTQLLQLQNGETASRHAHDLSNLMLHNHIHLRDEDDGIDKIMSEYTGADNDEYINEIMSDFTTKGSTTLANPDGVELTKFNGERATRKFLNGALHLNEE